MHFRGGKKFPSRSQDLKQKQGKNPHLLEWMYPEPGSEEVNCVQPRLLGCCPAAPAGSGSMNPAPPTPNKKELEWGRVGD